MSGDGSPDALPEVAPEAGAPLEPGPVTPGKFAEWQRRFGKVEGWFNQESAAVWDCLLTFQEQQPALRGHFLEIGVFHGRSASLTWLHGRPGEEFALCDPYRLESVKKVLERIRPRGLRTHPCVSSRLSLGDFEGWQGACRWLHVDGEHTGTACAQDLELADALLHDRGVIVVDDFMAPNYPQVTAAVFAHVFNKPTRLRLFLCGFQKGYLARPKAMRAYLAYVRDQLQGDLAARGMAERLTLWKTTSPDDMNCFGMRIWDGRPMVGLDWDKGAVLI